MPVFLSSHLPLPPLPLADFALQRLMLLIIPLVDPVRLSPAQYSISSALFICCYLFVWELMQNPAVEPGGHAGLPVQSCLYIPLLLLLLRQLACSSQHILINGTPRPTAVPKGR